MAAIFVSGLQRREITVSLGAELFAFPGDMRGPVTLTAKSSGAGANNIEMTYSSEADIQAATADWVAVDASLTAVGTARAVFALTAAQGFPTAFRVTRAVGDFEFAVQGIRA